MGLLATIAPGIAIVCPDGDAIAVEHVDNQHLDWRPHSSWSRPEAN
jgi:hypothetical protein